MGVEPGALLLHCSRNGDTLAITGPWGRGWL
jgi:hypothetical protein